MILMLIIFLGLTHRLYNLNDNNNHFFFMRNICYWGSGFEYENYYVKLIFIISGF